MFGFSDDLSWMRFVSAAVDQEHYVRKDADCRTGCWEWIWTKKCLQIDEQFGWIRHDFVIFQEHLLRVHKRGFCCQFDVVRTLTPKLCGFPLWFSLNETLIFIEHACLVLLCGVKRMPFFASHSRWICMQFKTIWEWRALKGGTYSYSCALSQSTCEQDFFLIN